MKPNYALEMDKALADIRAQGRTPRLLLHVCCAPCSSAVLTELAGDFEVTVYFDNPNMDSQAEYDKRAAEAQRLVNEFTLPIEVVAADWDPASYDAAVNGVENAPEGGARCARCFALRLDRSAAYAKAQGFDWYTTTLTVSPRKDADLLNRLGQKAAREHGIPFLPSDFKKRDGYLNSIRRSQEHHLYRQDYCGCVYSKRERDARPARQPDRSSSA